MSKSNLDAATKPSIILRRPRFWLLTAALIVVASVVSLASCRIIANLDSSLEPDFLGRFRGGTLLIAGGGELPPIVKQRFWELAGGKNSRLVIIPAFAATPTEEARLIGFGVDEGTALFVQVARGRLGVLGKSYVMACIPDLDSDSLRLEVL